MVHKYSELDLMQARIKEVPNGWSFLPIAKAFKIRNDLRKPISDEIRCTQQGTYPYYGPTKIQDYIDTYEQDGSFALIGEDGDHFLKHRSQSMTQLVDGKCTVNNHAHIIEGTNLASREWFYYYFMHRDIYSYLSRQGAGRYKLNKASLEKIYVLIPPSVEQKKIAQILSTWDQAISATEKLVENSQQQKKALMQQLLVEKKCFDGASIVFHKKRFSEVVKIDERSLGAKTPDNFEFDYISLSDVNLGKISSKLQKFVYKDAPSRARRLVKEGDILLSTVRPNLQGFAKVSRKHESCVVSTGFSVLTPKEGVCGDYLYHYLFSTHITGQINALVVGTNYPAINSSDVSKLFIYCPEYEDQLKIARILNSCECAITVLQKRLDCLKQEKQALMQQLLTGKKRVKVAA